ncbi:MAG: preprotein translocase subunit YajC [Candidatus Omnitrophica bacterium]|jgi:preprotein translocase subunit YajC|nr:preprotein translocase subunit YajC [Candidatus Omnitrophota bacterium]
MNFVFMAVAGEPNPLVSMVPVLLMFVIFYFLLIRPQQKQQKEHREFLKALDKNQEVVLSGGIHGVITQVKEDTVSVKIAENVRVEVDKSSVARAAKAGK